jgi:aminoglycoside phosphotransferase (APT) family kinase protein
MEKGACIGQGRTAEIFAWGEKEVLKLFRPEFSSPAGSAYEAKIARAIFATGAPSPSVGDVVEVEERAGIVYERIEGPSLEAQIRTRPWLIARAARTLAETQAATHKRSLPTLPSLRKTLQQRIQHATPLTPALRAAADTALERLPDGSALCHGDFHAGNVLLSSRGPLVIDWENATSGPPLADVARTLLLLRVSWLYAENPVRRLLRRGVTPVLIALYMRRYRQLHPASRQEINAWALPVAAARLSEGVTQEESLLLKWVAQLADRIPADRRLARRKPAGFNPSG